MNVAYHDGPPEISFYGRAWRKGVPQPVSEQDWEAMRARGDFAEFDFRVETHHPSPITYHEDEE